MNQEELVPWKLMHSSQHPGYQAYQRKILCIITVRQNLYSIYNDQKNLKNKCKYNRSIMIPWSIRNQYYEIKFAGKKNEAIRYRNYLFCPDFDDKYNYQCSYLISNNSHNDPGLLQIHRWG